MLSKWISIKDKDFLTVDISIKSLNDNPNAIYYKHVRVNLPQMRETYEISIVIDTNSEKESFRFIKDLFDKQYGINGKYGYANDYKFDVSCALFSSHGSLIKSFYLDPDGLMTIEISSDYVKMLPLDVRRNIIIEEILNGRD